MKISNFLFCAIIFSLSCNSYSNESDEMEKILLEINKVANIKIKCDVIVDEVSAFSIEEERIYNLNSRKSGNYLFVGVLDKCSSNADYVINVIVYVEGDEVEVIKFEIIE